MKSIPWLVLLQIILLLIALYFLTACSTNDLDINELHDERMIKGCIVVLLDGKTQWISPIEGELCKIICTDELPDNFKFSYDRNGCKVSIGAE